MTYKKIGFCLLYCEQDSSVLMGLLFVQPGCVFCSLQIIAFLSSRPNHRGHPWRYFSPDRIRV